MNSFMREIIALYIILQMGNDKKYILTSRKASWKKVLNSLYTIIVHEFVA